MSNDNQITTNSGRIIFWNKIYGFIEIEGGGTVFFHRSKLGLGYKVSNVKLFDKVRFNLGTQAFGQHQGERVALHVTLLEKGNYKDYRRLVGGLIDWKGRFGHLISPQLKKEVVVFNTRIVELGNAQPSDFKFYVFHPVKSSKSKYDLFAFFAYPLQRESNIAFLLEAYKNSHLEPVRERLTEVVRNDPNMSPAEKLDTELSAVDLSYTSAADYNYFKSVVNFYKDKFDYNPDYPVLKKSVPSKYLIQLWESEIIDCYDLELLKPYFINITAEKKRALIHRFSGEHKIVLLEYYRQVLEESGRFSRINNDLKTFLSLLPDNDEYLAEFRSHIQKELSTQLSANEQMELWLNGYIDRPSEKTIRENFDAGNEAMVNKLLSRNDPEAERILEKIYEEYFLQYDQKDFDKNKARLVRFLGNFQEKHKDRFPTIAKIIQTKLNDSQQFLLWIFGIDLDFNGIDFFIKHHFEISSYYQIRFFLRLFDSGKLNLAKDLLRLANVTQGNLEVFVKDCIWDDLLSPTQIMPEAKSNFSFIEDVQEYLKKFGNTSGTNIDISHLSETIYNNTPKYTVHHVRLWLYHYVPEVYFDYVGFRKGFNELSGIEKDDFKKKAKPVLEAELVEHEIEQVIPCDRIVEQGEGYKVYEATAENIYFSNDSIMLRKEDGEYTKPRQEDFSSTGLNRIPRGSIYNKIPITITVSSENEISAISGLDEFFSQIHTGEIEKALGEVRIVPLNDGGGEKTYAEDWKLKEAVLKFLNENQVSNYEPVIVHEPRNRFRRLDKNSGIDNYEKTCIYSIETADGLAIVWENIDYSEDRATYIFKTSPTNYSFRKNALITAIADYAQLRSTLSGSNNTPELEIFRRKYGYVGSIRKTRGKNHPFPYWCEKLEESLGKPIPVLPSMEEMENIEDKIPKTITHSPHVKPKTPTKIDEDDIDLVDLDTLIGKPQPKPKKPLEPAVNKKRNLLKALKSFNESFLENLNI